MSQLQVIENKNESKSEDPFAGIKDLKSTSDIAVGERLKIAIVGRPKSGKSWMAATAPMPIMYYDFDDRAESLAGKPGIKIKTLFDIDQTRPTAVGELESDLNTFKYAKSQGKAIPKTFVLDSMTHLRRWVENELMRQHDKLYRTVKVSPTKVLRIPQGWDIVNGIQGYMNYIIAEFATLGNVVTVWHSKDEKDRVASTATETKYTGRLTVEPQYLETVLSTINHVFYIEVDELGRYKVQTQPNSDCGASTTMILPKETVPDIRAMLELHAKALAAKAKA